MLRDEGEPMLACILPEQRVRHPIEPHIVNVVRAWKEIKEAPDKSR
jgi:hypothetical protein